MKVFVFRVLSALTNVGFGFTQSYIVLLFVTVALNFNVSSRMADSLYHIQEREYKTSVMIGRMLDVMNTVGTSTLRGFQVLNSHLARVDGRPETTGQDANVPGIDSRLTTIEQAIGESPEKALSGVLLRKDFDNLQERYKSDIALMRGDLNKTQDANTWLVRLLVGLILSQFLYQFLKKDKSSS